MTSVLVQWERIQRRWVLILVIGLVAAAGALGASLVQGTTYTGRAALTIVSDRTPEEDSVLAQGYADYFNQATTREVLRQTAAVPTSVTLNARIAAASPIVYIEATSKDPALASDSATKLAGALRDNVNQGLVASNAAQIATLQRQLAGAQGQGNDSQVRQIQSDITSLESNSNGLKDLQLDGGVSSNPTNALSRAGAALVGGLLIGMLLALALGRFENRLASASEVESRLGLPVLAVVGRRQRESREGESDLLHPLMGLTNPVGVPVPGTLAVTGPVTARTSASRIAEALAGLRAMQGQRTLWVQSDLETDRVPTDLKSRGGVADFLGERDHGRLEGKAFSDGRTLSVVPPGSPRDDVLTLFSKAAFGRLFGQGKNLADLVVVDTPPAGSVEGQVVCSVADRVLIVLEEHRTRVRDTTVMIEALRQAGAVLAGVVLVRDVERVAEADLITPPDGEWVAARPHAPTHSSFAPGLASYPPAPVAPALAPRRPNPPRARPTPVSAGPEGSVDRTQPISMAELAEARAALAREDRAAGKGENKTGVTANGSPQDAVGGRNGVALPEAGSATPPRNGGSSRPADAGNGRVPSGGPAGAARGADAVADGSRGADADAVPRTKKPSPGSGAPAASSAVSPGRKTPAPGPQRRGPTPAGSTPQSAGNGDGAREAGPAAAAGGRPAPRSGGPAAPAASPGPRTTARQSGPAGQNPPAGQKPPATQKPATQKPAGPKPPTGPKPAETPSPSGPASDTSRPAAAGESSTPASSQPAASSQSSPPSQPAASSESTEAAGPTSASSSGPRGGAAASAPAPSTPSGPPGPGSPAPGGSASSPQPAGGVPATPSDPSTPRGSGAQLTPGAKRVGVARFTTSASRSSPAPGSSSAASGSPSPASGSSSPASGTPADGDVAEDEQGNAQAASAPTVTLRRDT